MFLWKNIKPKDLVAAAKAVTRGSRRKETENLGADEKKIIDDTKFESTKKAH